ncbi:MAG: recombinase RecA [Melioribacteraceae bacterium]|nr:recombinase RecA [Melioribacteraceae bacterium]
MVKEKKTQKRATALSFFPEALQATILSLQKENNESICVLGDVDGLHWHGKTISTGCITIDKAIGIITKVEDEYFYGLPGGRVIEIFGPESSGKTTLCNSIIASAQAKGGYCAFIDMEHSWDGTYAQNLGVDINKLIFSQPANAEEALDMAEKLIRSGGLDVIVVDSVAALVPKAEIEGEMGSSHMGLQARLMSQFFRKIVGIANKTNTMIIFTNQIRDKIGIVYGSPEVTTGGNALKFYTSVRMDIRIIAKLKDSSGDIIGNRCVVKIIKNKIAPPFRKAEFDIMYGSGMDMYGAVLDAGVDMGIVEKKGSWYAYCGEKLAQGRAGSVSLLKSNKTLFDTINKELIKKIYEEIHGNVEEDVVTEPQEQCVEPAQKSV